MPDQTPFFIVGAGRSGTTLLRLILTGHSRLHIPPETWFLGLLLREFPLTAPLAQSEVERVIATMVQHERWPDLGVPAEALRHAASVLRAPCLRDLTDLLWQQLRAGSGKSRIGDKTPHYFECVPQLRALYPEAKFIYLLRDGRDVAISWIDAGWQRAYEPGFEWPRAITALQRDWAAFPSQVLAVRYEDLIRQPEATTRRICAFLGEAFEPEMLEWRERTALVASRDRHLHRRLPQRLGDDAIGVWRRRLNGLECFVLEACLHRSLAQCGYDLRFASRAWRLPFALTHRTLRWSAPLLRRLIPFLQARGMLPRCCYF